MNFNETIEQLVSEIAEQEHCSRIKALAFLAACLQHSPVRPWILFLISHRECCFPEIGDTK